MSLVKHVFPRLRLYLIRDVWTIVVVGVVGAVVVGVETVVVGVVDNFVKCKLVLWMTESGNHNFVVMIVVIVEIVGKVVDVAVVVVVVVETQQVAGLNVENGFFSSVW